MAMRTVIIYSHRDEKPDMAYVLRDSWEVQNEVGQAEREMMKSRTNVSSYRLREIETDRHPGESFKYEG